MSQQGTVHSFVSFKDFGFISTGVAGEDIIVHGRSLSDGCIPLTGDRVWYDRNKYWHGAQWKDEAINVRGGRGGSRFGASVECRLQCIRTVQGSEVSVQTFTCIRGFQTHAVGTADGDGEWQYCLCGWWQKPTFPRRVVAAMCQ